MGRERNTAFLLPVTFVISTSCHCHLVHNATRVLCLHKDFAHPSILHNIFTHHVTVRHTQKKNWQVWIFMTIYKILIVMQLFSFTISTVKIQIALKSLEGSI